MSGHEGKEGASQSGCVDQRNGGADPAPAAADGHPARLAQHQPRNAAAVGRAAQTLGEIWESERFTFTTLAVGSRGIRTLVAPGALPALAEEAAVRLPTEALLMEGARRIDEWSRIEAKIPHLDVVPTLSAADEASEGLLDLLPSEWEVLAAIDGERSVRAIAALLARSEFEVAKTIFGLSTAGVVTVLERRRRAGGEPPRTPDLEELAGQGGRALAAGDVATVGRAGLLVIVWGLASLLISSMIYVAVTQEALVVGVFQVLDAGRIPSKRLEVLADRAGVLHSAVDQLFFAISPNLKLNPLDADEDSNRKQSHE